MAKKILSLDGGGIHGLMTALVLKDVEKHLPNPQGVDLSKQNILIDHFDYFAGTSTGSILAAGICTGMPLDTIIKLYKEQGENIFRPNMHRWGSRVIRTLSQGFSHPKHDDTGLEEELRKVFKKTDGADILLKDIRKPLLIQVYDATLHEPVIFKSVNPDHPLDGELALWELVKASSSAPTYFPAHALLYRDEKQKHAMIDGGVFANNPTLCALSEVYCSDMATNEKIVCVSCGTSEEDSPGFTVDTARTLGALEWALPMIGIFMGGASRHVHNLSKRLITKGDTNSDLYIRFQMITNEDIPIDEAAPQDIDKLIEISQDYISGHIQDTTKAYLHKSRRYDYESNLNKLLGHFGGSNAQ